MEENIIPGFLNGGAKWISSIKSRKLSEENCGDPSSDRYNKAARSVRPRLEDPVIRGGVLGGAGGWQAA